MRSSLFRSPQNLLVALTRKRFLPLQLTCLYLSRPLLKTEGYNGSLEYNSRYICLVPMVFIRLNLRLDARRQSRFQWTVTGQLEPTQELESNRAPSVVAFLLCANFL